MLNIAWPSRSTFLSLALCLRKLNGAGCTNRAPFPLGLANRSHGRWVGRREGKERKERTWGIYPWLLPCQVEGATLAHQGLSAVGQTQSSDKDSPPPPSAFNPGGTGRLLQPFLVFLTPSHTFIELSLLTLVD